MPSVKTNTIAVQAMSDPLQDNTTFGTTKEYVSPYYFTTVSQNWREKWAEYVKNLKEEDYQYNELSYDDEHRDIHIKKYRTCDLHFLDPNSSFYTVGKQLFTWINRKFYKYDLSDVFEFQLIRYRPGGEYDWHCDYGSSPVAGYVRKISMSIQLSDESDYEGGNLDILNHSNQKVVAPKHFGAATVFDSKLAHKAEPVTSGIRFVLVGWANGPRLR